LILQKSSGSVIIEHCCFIFRGGGNNYRRVRNSMPANKMGGEDGEDEETLYDRTESTSQF